MEASHTESLAAHYFRSGKLLIQIVLAPSPQSNRLSIAGNVSVPFSSICSTSCGQMAGLEGLLAVLRLQQTAACEAPRVHRIHGDSLSASIRSPCLSDSYVRKSEHVRPT